VEDQSDILKPHYHNGHHRTDTSKGIGTTKSVTLNGASKGTLINGEHVVALKRKVFQEHLDTHRITAQEFDQEVDDLTRVKLLKCLGEAIIDLLRIEQAVYLDRLGLIYPSYRERSITDYRADCYTIEPVIERSASFEKCIAFDPAQRELYGEVVDFKELASLMQLKLRREGLHWNELETLRYLRGLARVLVEQLAMHGFTQKIPQLGTLLALHNRQGTTITDWFNGADIFLSSEYCENIPQGDVRTFSQPMLSDAFEPFTSLYGSALHTFRVSVARELQALGLDTEKLRQEVPSQQLSFSVAVFDTTEDNSTYRRLLYVSDRLRLLSPSSNTQTVPLPCELVAHIELGKDELDRTSAFPDIPPRWPTKLFLLGWILIHSSPNQLARYGSGISLGAALDDSCSKLTTIILNNYSLVAGPQHTRSKNFNYLSLVGITEDEHLLAEQYSSRFLLSLLSRRNLDQTIRPSRSSILHRSSFQQSPTTEQLSNKIRHGIKILAA
jgi:hypothetical protein